MGHDPTGHARALLAIPAAVAPPPVYYHVFEQGPDPRASVVRPLSDAAPDGPASFEGGAEPSGDDPPDAVVQAAVLRPDVNGDGRVTPLDVLRVVNVLNGMLAAAAEGEATGAIAEGTGDDRLRGGEGPVARTTKAMVGARDAVFREWELLESPLGSVVGALT